MPPGMSIHSSVATSCMSSASGNSGASRSGVTGSFVPGCSGGSGWIPACTSEGMMLNHAVGMLSCDRSNRVGSIMWRPPVGRAPSLPPRRSARKADLTDRFGRDLNPTVDLAGGEHRQWIARGALERLTGLGVEHALARRAQEPIGSIVERAIGERAPLARAGLADGEQPSLIVRHDDAARRDVVGAKLTLRDLRERADPDELHHQAPRSAEYTRCTTVTVPRTERSTSTGSIAPGTTNPMISASTRSSRWNNPSLKRTPAASASARMWLTTRLTTSVINASAASVLLPSAARRQNKQENKIMSETRSSTESMNAPARLASPRCRATDPSKTSDAPARMRTPPAANHAPVKISAPVTTFNARDSRVSCHGRTPVQMRNARIPRYGHAKTRCIAPPAALSFFLGAGRSRTRGASRTGCPRSRPWTVMTGSAGDRLERDHPVAEGSSRSLVGDLVSFGCAHERRAEGRRGRDGPCSGRLLLGVFRQQVGLVLVFEIERLHGDDHAGTDLLGGSGRLNDLGVSQHRLDVADARLHESLLVLRGVVLGVLADVAVLARSLDAFRDRVPAGGRQLLQLRTEPGVGVQRQRRRRILAGGARWTIAQLLGEFGHPPESSQQRLARCEGRILRSRRVARREPDQERCSAARPLL